MTRDLLDFYTEAGVDALFIEALRSPAQMDAARKYPLIVWIHGGAWVIGAVPWNWVHSIL